MHSDLDLKVFHNENKLSYCKTIVIEFPGIVADEIDFQIYIIHPHVNIYKQT